MRPGGKSGSGSGASALLEEQAIPALLPEQVRRFTTGALRARRVRQFDAAAALRALAAHEGRTVLAVDIGGDKLEAASFAIAGGQIRKSRDVATRQGHGGAGYLDALREVADLAEKLKAPVGVSFAGPTDGTRLIAGPNLPIFMKEFAEHYDGDFARLFATVEVANDAEAGIMAGALEAVRRFPATRDVIYIINGSGLGGAVLTENTVYATEPGHIEITDQLNVFRQRKACGLLGAAYVCIEAVAAGKAGVEDLWLQQTGERLSGREISARYQAGHRTARELYRSSALITAHAMKGIARAFHLLGDPDRTVIVGHGGVFHVPGYGELLRAILANDLSRAPRLLFTKDIGLNTCLDGAAIAAVAAWA